MIQVLLKDIRLQGTHGVFQGEELWATTFRLNLIIDLKNDPPFVELNDTVDYSKVYEIVKSSFSIREQLLENLADRIYANLVAQFIQIHSVEISIIKEDPPIPGFSGEVGIVFKKTVGS
jgi:dihydroneopterin aldolase